MPWVSKKQERWGNSPAGHAALGDKGVAEWNSASKGKSLPMKAKKKAFGGPNDFMENMLLHNAARNLHTEGMIHSPVPGRTDKLPMNVPSGSYVLPADIPSALGQGNSLAGGSILKKMFSSGPYGMAAPRIGGGHNVGAGHLSIRPPAAPAMPKPPKMTFADGGSKDEDGAGFVPIVAAGGEVIIHPSVVKDIGHGSLTKGHRVLDAFVLRVRKEHIRTLRHLPPPKK